MKHVKITTPYFLLLFLLIGLGGCGGTATETTATHRTLTGNFQAPPAGALAIKNQSVSNQGIDQNTGDCDMVCTTQDGTLNTCDIEANGDFACEEPVGEQVCGIFCEGVYQGTLENSDGSHEVDLADNSNDDVDLGEVTCDGVDCTAENPPDTQNDQDGDRQNDDVDEDDDGDGIPDVEDNNCEGEGTLCDGNWGDCDNDADGIPCSLDSDESGEPTV